MKKWAVIDIGSNTIRLVIYIETINHFYKEVENIKAVARLRKYLNEENVLSNEGVQKCLTILKGFKEIIDFNGINEVKCVATATIRQAVNKSDVLERVKGVLGFDILILSEEEEAYLGFLAVVNTTAVKDGVTIDIGGGSTEITYYENKKLVRFHSFPFGVVSLKEKFMGGSRMTNDERMALQKMVLEAFESLPWLKNKQIPIVAIGGSARNIAQVHQHLKNYPLAGIHQYDMSPDDLHNILQMMESMEVTEIEKLEGLSKDRADIILPALEVFDMLCKYVQATRFIFSKRGLREGILYKEKGGGKNPSDFILENSIDHLVRDYGIEEGHSDHVAWLAKQIYFELSNVFGNKTNEYSDRLIEQSARIYYIGQYVDSDVSSQHTFNLLAHQSIDGITHKERLILALIASYKNWALLKQYSTPFIEWFSKGELKDIRIAGSMVKLASALDSSKRMLVKKIKVQKRQDELVFQLSCVGNTFVEQYQAEKQIRHLEKSLKYKIILEFISDR
ncbi:exopolyphosphatase [Mycobacteroides abscessus subsp. abscessus]|nr:exopolyphosphatase [Mycobacteroides abscessus subsp. abscessus]